MTERADYVVRIACVKHGDLYEQSLMPGGWETVADASKVKLLRDDIPRPTSGERILCPLCHPEEGGVLTIRHGTL